MDLFVLVQGYFVPMDFSAISVEKSRNRARWWEKAVLLDIPTILKTLPNVFEPLSLAEIISNHGGFSPPLFEINLSFHPFFIPFILQFPLDFVPKAVEKNEQKTPPKINSQKKWKDKFWEIENDLN